MHPEGAYEIAVACLLMGQKVVSGYRNSPYLGCKRAGIRHMNKITSDTIVPFLSRFLPTLQSNPYGFHRSLMRAWCWLALCGDRGFMEYDQHGPLAPMLSEAAGEAGQGSLMAWLEYRHDELLAELGSRRVRWKAWLQLFRNLDLRDANGNHPTLETARKAWQRVRAQKRLNLKARNPGAHQWSLPPAHAVQPGSSGKGQPDAADAGLHPDVARVRQNLARRTVQRPRPLREDDIT